MQQSHSTEQCTWINMNRAADRNQDQSTVTIGDDHSDGPSLMAPARHTFCTAHYASRHWNSLCIIQRKNKSLHQGSQEINPFQDNGLARIGFNSSSATAIALWHDSLADKLGVFEPQQHLLDCKCADSWKQPSSIYPLYLHTCSERGFIYSSIGDKWPEQITRQRHQLSANIMSCAVPCKRKSKWEKHTRNLRWNVTDIHT